MSLKPVKLGCNPICCESPKERSKLMNEFNPESGILIVGLRLLYKSY